MKNLRTISIVLIAVASAGLLLQCGAPADLLGKVEERVTEAQQEQIPGPFPKIQITQNSTMISSGSDYTINSTVVGTPIDVVFSIKNSGDTGLTLTGSPNYVSLSSTVDFSVISQPDSYVSSGSTTEFTLRFNPSSTGAKSVIVNIASDDPDHSLYSFTVNSSATGAPEPEINLKQGSTSITSGGSYSSMGSVAVGSSRDVTFTIENIGTADLDLDGSPNLVSIDSTSDFSVTEQPSQSTISTNSSTTFTLRFLPQSGGSKSVTVTIPNDDSDEDPYTFTASGTGLVPEINISRGGTNISSGGSIDIGSYSVGTPNAIGFSIENTGGAQLLFTGTPNKVTMSGDVTDFSVLTDPPDSVAAGDSDTFAILFEPQSSGTKSASLSIPNNDSNENPYTFTVTGTGIIPDIKVSKGTEIGNGGSYAFPDTKLGEASSAVFTIENVGSDDLVLTGTPRVQLSDTSIFTITTQPNDLITPSSPTTFNLQFEPSETGTHTSTLTIPNNDPDEDPFIIYTEGEATPWYGIQSPDSGADEEGLFTSINTSGNNVYICYSAYDNVNNDYETKFAKSSNGGADWTVESLQIDADDKHKGIQMTVDGEDIFIAKYYTYHKDLHLLHSDDDGATWDTKGINDDGIDGGLGIACDGSDVFITYVDNYNLIVEKISYDLNTVDKYYIDDYNFDPYVSIAVDSSDIYITTSGVTDYHNFYKISKSDLSNWTTTNIERGETEQTFFYSNSIEVQSGVLYASYIYYDGDIDGDWTVSPLKFAKSTDGGSSWAIETIDVSCLYFEDNKDNGDEGLYAEMSFDGQDIYVSYYSLTADSKKCLSLAKSTDGGSTWSTSVIDTTGDRGMYNSIDVQNGVVCISYFDDTNNDLLFAKSIDGGATW